VDFQFGQEVYVISRRGSKWKVNKNVYVYYGQGVVINPYNPAKIDKYLEGYVQVRPKKTAYGKAKPVNKKKEDVFASKIEAERECERRNQE
jgi:hypothetical protein